MSNLYNIYCDETCHLEFDHQPNMVLGAVSAPKPIAKHVNNLFKEMKERHGFPPYFEMKWGKVSPAKVEFYLEAINLLFDIPELRFRCVVAPKGNLNHTLLEQTHDNWYYRMYYLLLDALIDNRNEFAIYLDIKDDSGQPERDRLREVLCTSNRDFNRERVIRVQAVQSHEVSLVQLVDVLIGIVCFANRPDPFPSKAKMKMVEELKRLSHYSLRNSTPRGESKFNILHWQARELV